jgi:hypothetical protein
MLRMKSRNLNTFTACASIQNCEYCTSLARQNRLRRDVCTPKTSSLNDGVNPLQTIATLHAKLNLLTRNR